jgi:Ni,Fe-hydrogenase III small subunit/formate hydrogenlyase subunit 6/NADH:ubiquinone oxidoreductase subunit I
MIKAILARIQQGYRTMRFPAGAPPPMPDRFRGKPEIEASPCPEGCRACADACPTGAMSRGLGPKIDLGLCLFCADCEEACPRKAIAFTRDYRLAVRDRGALVIDQERRELALATALDRKLKRLLGRSLKLRQLCAGGCGACEADSNVLNTVGWDLGRFGIQFVASPRHADGLLITGPVTKNMELALMKTYDAMPEPKIVIAVGSCAISGGPYVGHAEVNNGVPSIRLADGFLPVDLFIPGCPPHPLTILDGLLRLTGRIEDTLRGRAKRKEGERS